MAKASDFSASLPKPIEPILPALTPNLQQITQSVITKQDLLEMVYAEEEDSLKRQIQEVEGQISEIHALYEKKVSEEHSKDIEDKLTTLAKTYGCKVDKFTSEISIRNYDRWTDYQSREKGKDTTVIVIEAYCNGPGVTLKLSMEKKVNNDPGRAKIKELEKRKENLSIALSHLPGTIKRVSAGITRKVLESANEGKQILSLLQSLRQKLS